MRKGIVARLATMAGALVVVLVCAAVASAAYLPGSSGLGDPFFPLAGNGGYDVSNYSLTLDYTPSTNQLAGVDVITARATQDLSRFDLDLRGFAITQLLVNGQSASYTRDGQELIITPKPPLRSGSTFTVTVGYAGHAERDRRSGRVERGLDPDQRRRLRRRRATGLAGLVRRQRQPPRQGDVRLRGDGARRA